MATLAHIGIFKELLEISKAQSECIADGRIQDAVKIIEAREALIERLKGDNIELAKDDNETRDIIKEITGNDDHMMLVLAERRESIIEKLKKRIEAKKVISAYNENR